MNAEQTRLEEARSKKAPWKKWGPYLSERQWGTVREDYSESGDAWNYWFSTPFTLVFPPCQKLPSSEIHSRGVKS